MKQLSKDMLHTDICYLQNIALEINEYINQGIEEVPIEAYNTLLSETIKCLMIIDEEYDAVQEDLKLKDLRIDELLDHMNKLKR